MSIGVLLLLILLVLLLCGGIGHQQGAVNFVWPGGIIGVLLVILLVLLILRVI